MVGPRGGDLGDVAVSKLGPRAKTQDPGEEDFSPSFWSRKPLKIQRLLSLCSQGIHTYH